jgi:hypothetical protein
VHINSPGGNKFAGPVGSGSFSKTTGKWVREGMTFYLQNVSGGLPLTAANTLATVTVHLYSGPLQGTISASPNPIVVSDGTGLGVTTVTWSSSGTSAVEVHINSPTGSLFSSTRDGMFSQTTGKWVTNGTVFYLQNVSNGLPLTSANTLATVTVNVTH